ncbi:MAG: DNA-directed RNA polymerase subunit A' [Aigarchaeota archaeon]|nr:DNA-directed RNA polymerase subunit A' [Candidatus Pelearchaeum maunauluense]
MSYTASIAAIRFGILSPDLIRKMSVAEISSPDTYDEDGMPIPTGVMDPRLGTLEPGQRCKTCGNTYLGCPGHFGHIELPVPVIHVGFAKTIYELLKCTCRSCGRILLSEDQINQFKEEIIRLQQQGRPYRHVFFRVKQRAMAEQVCPHCGEKQHKIELEKPVTIVEVTDSGPVRLHASTVRSRLERIPDDDLKLLDINPETSRPEWMVLTVLPVPPVYVRPSITLESGFRSEDDLTHKLVDILRVAQRLRENINAGSPSPVIAELSDLLQYHVTTYINNEAAGTSPAMHRSGRVLKTLAQRLKGKEGRFRLNLSGKRVDFSARTVISPDINIGVNEVGVPVEIAMQLTVAEKVTIWNVERLRQLVRNGPDKYPGAKYVIRPDGKRIRLKFVHDLEGLANALEPGYTVERHLQNGDIVLFNRQPSLHRMSIMAHIVRVLPYRTFRLNLAVCTPYNADFDGDEMNLHVPQSEEAQTEARILLLVQNNIISPRYGAPIIGAIRDFLTSMYLLTREGTSFNKREMAQLLAAIKYSGPIPEPAIKKPEPRWTGKQIFSLLMPRDFNHTFRSSFDPNRPVVIRNGELVEGVIDKNAIGIEKANSILHRLARDYGNEVAREFLDKVVRLANTYLEIHGFTFSVEDLTVPREAYEEISRVLRQTEDDFLKLKAEYERGKREIPPGMTETQAFESDVLQLLSEARDTAGRIVRSKISQESSAVIMARTGARGTLLNIDQMVAVVGQQSVRRERIHRGFNDRVLTFFKKGDLSPRARGFVYNSFVSGLDPIEFFFHAVGGRDGLVDTAVRTQQSGYMQRRLINALESLYIDYDGTVRTADEKRIIQFLYGEDGVDPAKSDHGIVVSPDALINKLAPTIRGGAPAKEEYIEEKVREYCQRLPPKIVRELAAALKNSKATRELVDKAFEELERRYKESRVEPGDAVGVITAQSIGEPGTQLTLRTFHFAGVREQSILLGLPRLIEIVDARRTPSTPFMRLPLTGEYAHNLAKAKKLAKQLQFTKFGDLVEEMSVNYKRGTLIIKLNREIMEDRGITKGDIEKALKLFEGKVDEDGETVTIKLKEDMLLNINKLKERLDVIKVKGVRKIKRAIVKQEKDGYVIETEGSNLKEVLEIPGIDHARVETNDIYEIAEVLGIEAARNAIIKEAKNVMREQGLDVDIRHLLLLADMMTVSGAVRQIGRHGVVKLKSSVLARAAFEISVQTLMDAAARGEVDNLRGNVERILIGKEIPVGTGMVTLLMRHAAGQEENQNNQQ